MHHEVCSGVSVSTEQFQLVTPWLAKKRPILRRALHVGRVHVDAHGAVRVQVDEPREHTLAGGVDDGQAARVVPLSRDRDDAAALDADVGSLHPPVDECHGVCDVGVLGHGGLSLGIGEGCVAINRGDK